jgi:hypothetical protein
MTAGLKTRRYVVAAMRRRGRCAMSWPMLCLETVEAGLQTRLGVFRPALVLCRDLT